MPNCDNCGKNIAVANIQHDGCTCLESVPHGEDERQLCVHCMKDYVLLSHKFPDVPNYCNYHVQFLED